ncbi:hypothetical protein Dsin_000176 [Dipteronia sinensis]|uniref:Pop1 N-terminal domain-containing protein n=1 Tax=Dipteronia sinensis TaxID=43782 RepID=A0AAE0DKJ2_9ROSI|nr:hypothetical protein Dsin_000176 [Dipteronia sinensis]
MLLLRSPEPSMRLLRSLEASTLLLSFGLAFILEHITAPRLLQYYFSEWLPMELNDLKFHQPPLEKSMCRNSQSLELLSWIHFTQLYQINWTTIFVLEETREGEPLPMTIRPRRKKSRKRWKLGITDKSNVLESDKDQTKVSRRLHRRMGLKKNPESGFSASGDGTKRLRTHVWHSKRFTMKKLWGFYLPLGLQGRGRGSRAVLRWFKQGVLVHDASYHIAVQLEGPEDSLRLILQMVLVPSPSSQFEDISHSVLSGVIYGSAMLHRVGVPLSQPIAPVTYRWKPYPNHDREGDGSFQNAVECNDPHVCHSPFRQIWLWMHASAFDEGYNALKLACQKQMPAPQLIVSH